MEPKTAGPAVRLNHAFCVKHTVVPVEWGDGMVTVGMADPADEQVIAALRFATGAEIAPLKMAADEVHSRLKVSSRVLKAPYARTTADIGQALPYDGAGGRSGRSLFGRLSDVLDSRIGHPTGLSTFGSLLSSGYTPAEAGEVILAARSHCRTGDDASVALAGKLRRGETLSSALATVPTVPSWIPDCLRQLPPDAEQSATLVDLLDCERMFAKRRAAVTRLMWELTVLAGLLVFVWSSVSVTFAALVGIGGLIALHQLGRRFGTGPRGQFLRANVLTIVAATARRQMPPALAIRCGLERLQAVIPTWGKIPDSRKDLAAALDLDLLSTAILLRGNLHISAECAASESTRLGLRALAMGRWTIRVIGSALFLAAIAVVMSP